MILRTIHIILFLLIFPLFLSAQDYQKQIKKAEKNFQLGHYAKAIPYYKEALLIKSNSSWMSKLADCYRLTNQIDHAAETYEKLFFTAKKIKPRIYLRYAEVLINQGNYVLAKDILSQYIELDSKDENAKVLLSNLDKIKEIPSFYAQVELSPFNHNTEADEHGAVFLDDGIVFVSDRDRGPNFFKEKNQTTGREFLSLYFAPRTERMEYGTPTHLPRKINKLNKNTGPASFTKDGTTIVFSQNSAIENKSGVQTLQLYIAKRENGTWKNIKKFPFCNDNLNYMHPAISPDGNTLFFVSDKSKRKGGTDIFISKLADGKWSRPESLGPAINSEYNEGFPFVNEEGRLFFCSKGHLGYGGYDIFYSDPDDNGEWSPATNLGQPINSSSDDISFCLNSEGNYGLFTSSRERGDDDIFLFRFKEDNMILSLELMDNEDGTALSDATIQVVPSGSGADTSSVDIASDKTEVVLEKDKSYDIIIMKEGFEKLIKKIDALELENTFLKVGAQLKKEETGKEGE